MSKKIMSRVAVLAHGVLLASLAPKIAQDAKIDFRPLLAGVTEKTFGADKAKISEGLKVALKDKLRAGVAMDATINDVNCLLDKLEADKQTEGLDAEPEAVTEPNSAVPVKTAGEEDDEALDADPIARAKDWLKGKGMSEDDIADFEKSMAPKAADADPPLKPEVTGAKDAEEEKVDKKAMDQAIKIAADAARKQATADAARVNKEIRDAERAVKPWVGDLVAQDSAEAVYRTALGALNVDVSEVKDVAALKVILANVPKPGAGKHQTVTSSIAQDAAAADDFNARFPGTARIGHSV